jgi:hypothetical protein
MPIDYRRDDLRRLITVTVTEPFSFDELLSQTDRQCAEQAWEYAVLYDSRATEHLYPASEIHELLTRTQVVGGGRPRGPVGAAIPARPDMFNSGLQLSTMAGSKRDIEILLTVPQVDAWLARHAVRRR